MNGILVKDLSIDTSSPQEQFLNTVKNKLTEQRTPVNTIVPYSRIFNFTQIFAAGAPYVYDSSNVVFFNPSSNLWNGYIYLPPLQSLTLARPYQFILDIGVSWVLINPLTANNPVPDSNFQVPVYLTFGASNPNKFYDDPLSPYFTPWFCDHIGWFMVKTNKTYKWVQQHRFYHLENTIVDRPFDPITGTRGFTLQDRTKITERELDQIYNQGIMLHMGVFYDTEGISNNNINFLQEITFYEVDWKVTASFNYFCNLSTLSNN
jgi:hypothetical protein